MFLFDRLWIYVNRYVATINDVVKKCKLYVVGLHVLYFHYQHHRQHPKSWLGLMLLTNTNSANKLAPRQCV